MLSRARVPLLNKLYSYILYNLPTSYSRAYTRAHARARSYT
nr:MAG TPA: hypothetical protein [Caudoviricetes sp.]